MKCFKRLSKFYILHFTTALDIQLQSDLTDERRASVMEEGREGVSEVSKSNCQFLYPQTVW